jgi:hypothetical protein
MLIAIHQPNFIPPFPYFVKMALCDRFVVLCHAKYSNENYQNFQKIFGKKWTSPVMHEGHIPNIIDKKYATGQSLAEVNTTWILAIAETLGIDADKLVEDFPTEKTGTERLVEIIKKYDGNAYIANASAPDKYLDLQVLADNRIRFVPFVCEETRNVLELFNDIGIKETIELLHKTVTENKEAIICKV